METGRNLQWKIESQTNTEGDISRVLWPQMEGQTTHVKDMTVKESGLLYLKNPVPR